MKLNVENFGKIKSASVELNGYAIFVGDNNSGKSYLMQLVYGLLDAFRYIHGIGDIPSFHLPTDEKPMVVEQNFLQEYLDALNAWLEKEKNAIVKKTFNYEIAIGRIWLSHNESSPVFSMKTAAKSIAASSKESKNDFSRYEFFVGTKSVLRWGVSNKITQKHKERVAKDTLCRLIVSHFTSKNVFGDDLLYLPACRSGLNLLYKEAVGEYASRDSFMESGDSDSLPPAKKLGLTKPFLDYMLFLMQYKEDEDNEQKNKSLISFVEKEILKGGHIISKNDEIQYITEDGLKLPLHVSSSMVNEISPIRLLLSSRNRIKNIFYDEIETSQHPKTQLQLARLLNRLVNAGFKMIVSTHSDTMAAAISNLVALSFAKDKERKCKVLGYEKDDLLQKDVVHAYQFIKDEDGRSVVTEIEKFNELGMGYDFSLFSEVSSKLFNDAKIIYGEDDVGSKC
ncbi:AAA family ATPase [uncultured Fibrobacter sp.]|uniref:AAA family ATPase n=1 Tax=uncultured Fibrobacter sp. TaxID=261512 RepID=UPI0025F090D3|nr:AAA family ATPase [uncultured Fibrobacter sp.]